MKQLFISILLASSLFGGTVIAQNAAKTKQIYKGGEVEFYISVAEIDSVIFTQDETNNAMMHIMQNSAVIFQSAVANIDSIVYFVPVESISLNHTTLSLHIDETYRLIATILPENATNQNVRWASNNSAIADVDANGTVTAFSQGTAIISARTVCGEKLITSTITVTLHPSLVDEGVLINGVRWATRNVNTPGTFAENPESPGMFYQWNRRVAWAATSLSVNNWNTAPATGTTWTRENDPCPAGWRVPTRAELQSLNSAGSEWAKRNGVVGRLYGTAPNQIFMPASGWRNSNGALHFTGANGYWWSNAQIGNTLAWSLWFGNLGSHISDLNRAGAFSVRCVAE